MTLQKRITGLAEAALILTFLVAISLPAVLGVVHGDTFESLKENRERAPLPKAPNSLAQLAQYPAKFEAFFKDRYGLRKDMIRLHNRLQLDLFQRSKNKRVVVGKEGWLFLGDQATAYSRAEEPLSFEWLESYRKELEAHRDWMANQGIAFVPFIAPIKHAIYPEYLPESELPAGRMRRKQQVLEHFAKYSELQFIDLTPALWAKRLDVRLFHKTDSHWNLRGAFIGYRTLMEQCPAIVTPLKPFSEALLTWRTKVTPGLDLARLLGLSDELREEHFLFGAPGLPLHERIRTGLCKDCGIPPHALRVSARKDGQGPRAVAFGDSFFNNLEPFFAPHFSRLVHVPSHRIHRALIEHEKPAVVFLEVVERQFMFPQELLDKR